VRFVLLLFFQQTRLESSKSQPNKLQELKEEDTSFHYHYTGVPHFAQTFDVERLR
jgi:hypothetical protein